jgi:hypothetical protein
VGLIVFTMPIGASKSDSAVITNCAISVLKRNICTPMDLGTSGGKSQSVGKNACPKELRGKIKRQ